MARVSRVGVLIGILVFLTSACTGVAGGDSGQVAMMPFFDEAAGVRGVEPTEGWSEQAMLIQNYLPGTIEDRKAEMLERTNWTEVPASTGIYRGRAHSWQLYSGLGKVVGAGSQVFQIDIGVAEDDSGSYLVVLLTRPEHYEEHTAMYQSVFMHALYAIEPMPEEPADIGAP